MENVNNKVKQKNTKKIWAIILSVIILIITFLSGFFTYRLTLGSKMQSLNWAIEMIDKYGCYFDEEGKVIELSSSDYARLLVENLDNYSTYYTSEQYNEEVDSSNGNNLGIGITFSLDATGYRIFKVLWNSPAEKAGLKDGDVLLGGYIDNVYTPFSESFLPMPYLKSFNEGDFVRLKIDDGTTEKEVTVKKQAYVANYVKYYDNEKTLFFSSDGNNRLEKEILDANNPFGLDAKTAYIRIYLFEGNVSSGIEQAFNYLGERGKTKLILDLRDNGGGFMDDLKNVSSYLIKKDGNSHPLVAVAIDKNKNEEKFYANGSKLNSNIKKFVVLANENTASASECLIGAMLHYNTISRQQLVIEKNSSGTARTFGKGIMQTTYKNVLTGEAIKLTTAKIYFPDKTTSIHGVGIRTVSENEVEKGTALNRAIEILSE